MAAKEASTGPYSLSLSMAADDTANLDLSTQAGIHAYLQGTPFASTIVDILPGGFANYSFRLRLANPYEGRGTLIAKHAKPYLKNWQTVPFALDRQRYEFEAIKRVRAWLPEDAMVTVPVVHRFDEEYHIIIMDDCGEDAVCLEDMIKSGCLTVTLSSIIGAFLGEFLGRFHTWSRNNAELSDYFKENVATKKTLIQVIYQPITDMLTAADSESELAKPQLKVTENDLGVINAMVKQTTQALLSAHDTMVMGDFRPGNIMVLLDENKELKQIYVIDWEVSTTGLRALEIGHFCAEVYFFRRSIPGCQETALALLDCFLCKYNDIVSLDYEECKQAIFQVGAWLIILGPSLYQGNEAARRQMGMEGVEMIVRCHMEDEKWLEESFFRPLLKNRKNVN
ncbi:kinase-like domain-containing protein [Crucibulum laeve]|uniref:Kinase-like domain-containing protein n=1 Tax=Crucibulum laeve TaxID=68775 RepID=A0A5C3M9B0_9AGAR|nr:kinase-like domain-containing protein [Crucibulum laeve]